jgi:hypothetical protein
LQHDGGADLVGRVVPEAPLEAADPGLVGDVGIRGGGVEEEHAGVLDDRLHGEGHRRADVADDHPDLVLRDEPPRRGDALGGRALAVARHELDRLARDAAGLVDLLGGELRAALREGAVAGVGAGVRADEADSDHLVAVLCERGRRESGAGQDRRGEKDGFQWALGSIEHRHASAQDR